MDDILMTIRGDSREHILNLHKSLHLVEEAEKAADTNSFSPEPNFNQLEFMLYTQVFYLRKALIDKYITEYDYKASQKEACNLYEEIVRDRLIYRSVVKRTVEIQTLIRRITKAFDGFDDSAIGIK